MKSHPSKEYDDFAGMHSADPPDRIDDRESQLVRNGYCDATGRIVKSKGVTAVASGASLGITPAMGRVTVRSLHTYEGRVGENPHSRELAIVGDRLVRSKQDNLASRWDEITLPAEIDTWELDRAAAGVFRNEYFYHQNGFDPPFRVKCEEDDPATTLTTDAELLGLRPPAYGLTYASKTVGEARRFPPNVDTSYAVTFVYGVRGESGPSIVQTLQFATADGTNDSWTATDLPIGPSGVTKRRIYRSEIGRGQKAVAGGLSLANSAEFGPKCEMFLLAEIPDNTTTAFVDSFDDASLDYLTRIPQPRPFVPIARYQIMHLDRLFWAKLKEHPWTLGVMADITRAGFTNYRVSISNTGSGTITFEKYNGAWSTDFTVPTYKTKTLRTILSYLLSSGTTGLSTADYTAATMAIPAAGVDLDRTYTFQEISQREIYDRDDVYWFVAIDDDLLTQGMRWFPNRFAWSDIAYPEQVSAFNAADLTRFGSKRITNLILMDNTPVNETDTDSWLIPGSFIPDRFGVPQFEVHRSQASHGSICTRPDATATIPNEGVVMIAHDALRKFRGESSDLAALQIKDLFKRVLTEPVSRDQVSMIYYAGELFIAMPTYEVSAGGPL